MFGAKGCANCHAINGVGKAVGPDLGRGQVRSYYDLAAAFWNHYPAMVAQMREQRIQPPRMSQREMGDLIAFLATADFFDSTGDAERGKALFTAKTCVRCHQIGGVGGVVGPNLDHLGATNSPIDVAVAMWNHAPAMLRAAQSRGIARPSFAADELADLLAYLRAAGSGPMDRPLQLFPGNAEQGRKAFRELGCIRCHSIQGEGGTRAPDLAQRARPIGLLQFAATLWNKEPAMLEAMREMGIQVPQLEAGQMADLVAYLTSVRYFRPEGNAASGKALLGDRGCLRCHTLEGRGGRRAADLAKAPGIDSPAAVVAAMWNHGRLAPADTRDRAQWPTLTPEEVRDIAAFFIRAGATR